MKTRVELIGGFVMGVIFMMILSSFGLFGRPEAIGLIVYYVGWIAWISRREGERWTRPDFNLLGGTVGLVLIATFLPNPANNILTGMALVWWIGYQVYFRRTAKRRPAVAASSAPE